MAEQSNDTTGVTRVYRAAIRLGDDFITLEETIALPLDASDEDIARAIDLGQRIYQAQHAAVQQQAALLREGRGTTPTRTIRNPEAPASESQRNYVASLQQELTWSTDQLSTYAHEQGVSLVDMTKGQASTLIDGLKRLAEERAAYHAPDHPTDEQSVAEASGATYDTGDPETFEPIREQQYKALLRLAHDRGIDLDETTHDWFGVPAQALSRQQAGELISKWQRRASRAEE